MTTFIIQHLFIIIGCIIYTSNVKNVEHQTQNSQTTRSVMAINVINDLLTHM